MFLLERWSEKKVVLMIGVQIIQRVDKKKEEQGYLKNLHQNVSKLNMLKIKTLLAGKKP